MRRVGLVGALVLGLTNHALAQPSRAAQLRLQRARVDSIEARWLRAAAILHAYDDSVARSRARLDTLRAGSLTVLVAPAIRGRVEPAVVTAARQLDSLAGPAARRVAGHWLVVRQLHDTVADTVAVASITAPNSSFPKGREVVHLWGALTDSLVSKGLRQAALRQIASEMPGALVRWVGGDVGPDTVDAFTWTQVRLDLVSSPTIVARRCYEGDLNACKLALRLVPVRDPATEWFDAAGRRRFLTERSRFENAIAVACRDGDDAACLTGVRQLDVDRMYWVPATGLMVVSLAKTAIRIGGRGAYDRFLGSPGVPAEALTNAAGVPLDSVLRTWQRSAHDTRLPSQDISFGIAASSLLWIAVCGALSLRSSRWR